MNGTPRSSRAAIVLAGGFSRRMGRDKAWLPFGTETLLERVVRLVRPVVDEVVVVTREGQAVPGAFRVVHDPPEGLGPLAGLATGLSAISSDYAFLTACDAPFLVPEMVDALFDFAEDHDVAIPEVDGFPMTTCAVYSRATLAPAQVLLEEERLRPLFLIRAVNSRTVTADELRPFDPELQSFRNCNTPEAYEQALADAGLA